MLEVPEAHTLGDVDRDVARQVVDRRNRLGMSQRQLAMRARIDRETLKKLEDGHPGTRETTVQVVLSTLGALEHEMGAEPSEQPAENQLVEFRFGDVVVRGPVRDAAELEASLVRLVRQLGLGPETGS